MQWMNKLQTLFRKAQVEQELDDELRFHLEKQIEQNIASGMSVEEAHYAALRTFGGVEQVKEECREAWGVRVIEELMQDVRYGLRQLRRNPGFTAVVILTLALGIGMNTAVFSVVNAVLLNPLAYPNADRLVWLSDHDFKYGWGDNMASPAAYALWTNEAHSFESMVAYGNQDLAFVAGNEASQERVASVTDNFWSMTGAQPALGSLFRLGQPNAIVLSYAIFERRFGSDPHVIGKTVTLNGHQFTITGVLPANFRFLFPQEWWSGDERREIDAYIPLPAAILRLWDVTDSQLEAVTKSVGPAPYAVYVIGKLRPDVPIERARAEMEPIYARVAQEHYPSWKREFVRLRVAPLKEKLVGNARYSLMVLLGAVGFVLLIASANIANLLLARTSARQREIAIRAAMGAGRSRLIRQLLVESVLLALLGGAAGLILARWALAIFVRLGSEVIPRVGQANLDSRVLAFALAVSVATGLLFGLGPALSFGQSHLHDALKDEARTSSVGLGRLRLRGLLVVGELALAIVLLTGAGLMLKSLWRMNTYPPGFEPEKILVMRVSLYGQRYADWLQQDAYIRGLLRRIEVVPGVEAAGVHRVTLNTAVKVEGALPSSPGEESSAAVQAVSAGYLRAMGVPLVRGNWPRDDSFDSFVVNESFVRETLGHGDPIGRHLSGSVMNGTIVGVVADFKTWQLDTEPSPEVYIPYQLPPMGQSVRVVVRSSGDPRLVASTIHKLASEIDPTQPVYDIQTLDHALSDSIASRRFNLFLLGTFAALAVMLAAIGIYGVIAYSVAQRTHEIGIRMALGAQKSDVLKMVVGQGLKLSLTGVGIGIVGALALTRFLSSLLYGVKPTDPLTFVTVSLLLLGVALLACYIPARRATKIDPMVALRYE